LMHLNLFSYGMRDRDLVCLLHLDVQFSKDYFLKKQFFLQQVFLAILYKISDDISCVGLFLGPLL
jgi:hypothetical protein